MRTDYHVHLESGPYTLEWVQKYLEVAKQREIKEVGFSEHGYRFKQSKEILYNPWIAERQTEDMDQYVQLVENAKAEGLPVKLGLEMDYIPGREKQIEKVLNNYPWDYVIGSVHWIDAWGFDLFEMRDQWADKNVFSVYETYFQIIKELLDTRLFDILGHVDVIKVFGHRPAQPEMNKMLGIYDRLVDQISKSMIAVEVSTAGLRKPVGELYPSPPIMERVAKLDIPILLNSDAHRPEHVGEDFEQGFAYIDQYGIKQIATFNQRKQTKVNLG